jgi:putative transposase
MVNSEQGLQFTCMEWVTYVKKEETSISMYGKGLASDNLFIERLYRSVKYAAVNLYPELTGDELYRGLTKYFSDYHQIYQRGINRKKPEEIYQKLV